MARGSSVVFAVVVFYRSNCNSSGSRCIQSDCSSSGVDPPKNNKILHVCTGNGVAGVRAVVSARPFVSAARRDEPPAAARGKGWWSLEGLLTL